MLLLGLPQLMVTDRIVSTAAKGNRFFVFIAILPFRYFFGLSKRDQFSPIVSVCSVSKAKNPIKRGQHLDGRMERP